MKRNAPLDLSTIPVVILCGGQGTRIREDGDLRPKPMVEVGGKPILWHIMKIYASHGFRRFILPLGYRGDYIKTYFFNYRITASDFTLRMDPNDAPAVHAQTDENDWEITFVDTGVQTLKGGRVRRVADHIKADTFHLTYGDGVTDVNLRRLHEFHLRHGKLGTVTVVRPPSRFGEMGLNGDKVLRFEEKPQLSTGHINGGFFVFRTDFLKHLSPDADCDLEFGALQKIAKAGQLRAFRHGGFWQCMDTPREREHLNALWEKGAPWKSW